MWSESVQVAQRGLAALLVLGLLFALVWALRRKGLAQISLRRTLGGGERQLSVMERLPLTPQHALFLVRSGNQVLLLSSSPSGINLIEAREPGALPPLLSSTVNQWER
jgi:flagellar biosynthetic protein FliO